MYAVRNIVCEHIHSSIISEVSNASAIITYAKTEADFLSKTLKLVLVR